MLTTLLTSRAVLVHGYDGYACPEHEHRRLSPAQAPGQRLRHVDAGAEPHAPRDWSRAAAMNMVEFEAAIAASLTERVWERHVEELAAALGYRSYHTHDSRRSAAGFPDLVLLRPPRPPIYAELKTERGKVSPAQQEWILELQAAGC